jgi:hypothetical protein
MNTRWDATEIRNENTGSQSILSPVYIDYRDRVMRWRDKLEAAGFALERERKARQEANECLADARLMDEQLRLTETQTGFTREGVIG